MTSAARGVPTAVLSEALTEQLQGRRVRSALFTTFSFDPGFFEQEILTGLFQLPFSQSERIRLVQLEDALRGVDNLAVYYDHAALAQEATAGGLTYERHDVVWRTGAFHPKLVLLLVDASNEPLEVGERERERSLIVGTLSANLTRAGWWENLECGHFEEIRAASGGEAPSAFRADLLGLFRQLEKASHADSQPALGAIRDFVLNEAVRGRPKRDRARGRWHTRLFGGLGRASLPTWLAGLGLDRHEWHVEAIAPFLDADAGTIDAISDALVPRELRVLLPEMNDGSAGVSEGTYARVAALGKWGRLPAELTRGSGQSEGGAPPLRRVHAKLYRLWHRDGRDLVVVGSPNLTRAAMSRPGAGNLEACFAVDISELNLPRRWWLSVVDATPEAFVLDAPTEEEAASIPVPASLRYDWANRELSCWAAEPLATLEVCEPGGPFLGTVVISRQGEWQTVPVEDPERLNSLLQRSSFLMLRLGESSWRVLVSELHGDTCRPSLLTDLTPAEILRYWSLLSPAQRASYLERCFVTPVPCSSERPMRDLGRIDSVFDRFAGIFHAFGQLEADLHSAITGGRDSVAEARLIGRKYDSLPVFLEKVVGPEGFDAVGQYVTLLAATALWNQVTRSYPEFIQGLDGREAQLTSRLTTLVEVRSTLHQDGDPEMAEFLTWYEEQFLLDVVSLEPNS